MLSVSGIVLQLHISPLRIAPSEIKPLTSIISRFTAESDKLIALRGGM